MWRLKALLRYLLLIAGLAAFAWGVYSAPRLLGSPDTSGLESRKAFAQVVGGAALLASLLFTWRNLRATEASQVTDRITKALTALGSNQESQRIGGAYILGRIAHDSSRDRLPLLETLTATVRAHVREEQAPYRRLAGDPRSRDLESLNKMMMVAGWEPPPPPHIQACITAICRLTRDWPELSRHIKLSGADLRKVNFEGADLRGADLYGARCEGAQFERADLRGADVSQAHFKKAILTGARLDGAAFGGADFSFAHLVNAKMREMVLEHDSPGWNPSGFAPDTPEIPDQLAIDGLVSESPNGVFDYADLRGADLSGTPLEKVSFREADLSLTRGLTSESLRSASGDHCTKLPVEVERPSEWPTS